MGKQGIEQAIMKAVLDSPKPQEPAEVAKKVSRDAAEANVAREAITSLIDQGRLKVTLDLKVRAEA